MRVSIVLIPNKHLETPHYKVERLRHDDERLDQAKASYERAESPRSTPRTRRRPRCRADQAQTGGRRPRHRSRDACAGRDGAVAEPAAPLPPAPSVGAARPSFLARLWH